MCVCLRVFNVAAREALILDPSSGGVQPDANNITALLLLP